MRKNLALILLVLLALLLASLITSPVLAQEDISASTSIEVDFPTALTFKLKASLSPVSSAVITKIVLRYKVDKITTVTLVSEVEPEFDPAPVVETSWEWDMRKASLPPGAKVSFRWRIEDALGHRLDTPWEAVTFDDDRYPWNSLTEGELTLVWYQGSRSFAQELLDAATEALDRLAKDTGAQLERPVKMYIYASTDDLRGALVFPQEWTGGVAFTEYGIVAIGIAPQNLAWGKRAVAHELSHLVTYQMTFNPYGGMPTWLNEGLSMYAEGIMEPGYQSLLDKAISEDSLFSVQSLSSSFPAHSDEANLSYAESYSLVEFLVRDYGRESMLQLLGIFKQGASYDKALQAVYGFDIEGLDARWRASLGLSPKTTPVASTPTSTPSPTTVSTPVPTPTLTPTPGTGFGCGSSPQETSSSLAMLGGLGVLLLLPASAELLRLRSKWRRGE